MLGLAIALLAAPAARAEIIDSCNFQVTEDSELAADLDCQGQDGIDVTVSGVTVDLGKHTLKGDATGGTRGVSTDNGVENVVIQNGRIEGFQTGVDLINSNGSIENENSSSTITGNRADFNHRLGIDSVSGVTGEGNRAKGNGNTDECVNVDCT